VGGFCHIYFASLPHLLVNIPVKIDLPQEKTENLRFRILLILFILLLLQMELITNNYKTYKNG